MRVDRVNLSLSGWGSSSKLRAVATTHATWAEILILHAKPWLEKHSPVCHYGWRNHGGLATSLILKKSCFSWFLHSWTLQQSWLVELSWKQNTGSNRFLVFPPDIIIVVRMCVWNATLRDEWTVGVSCGGLGIKEAPSYKWRCRENKSVKWKPFPNDTWAMMKSHS